MDIMHNPVAVPLHATIPLQHLTTDCAAETQPSTSSSSLLCSRRSYQPLPSPVPLLGARRPCTAMAMQTNKRPRVEGSADEEKAGDKSSLDAARIVKIAEDWRSQRRQGVSLVLPYHWVGDDGLISLQRLCFNIICRNSHMFDVMSKDANSYNDNVIFLSPTNQAQISASTEARNSSIEVTIFAVDAVPHFENSNTPTQYTVIRHQLHGLSGIERLTEEDEEVRFRHSSGVQIRLYRRVQTAGGSLRITVHVRYDKYQQTADFYSDLGFVEQHPHGPWPAYQFTFTTQQSDFWLAKPEVELGVVGVEDSVPLDQANPDAFLLVSVVDLASVQRNLDETKTSYEETKGKDQDDVMVTIIKLKDPAGNPVHLYERRDLFKPLSTDARLLESLRLLQGILDRPPQLGLPAAARPLLPNAPRTAEEQGLCSICIESVAVVAVIPCGQVYCERCFTREERRTGRCPRCDEPVKDRLPLYW